MSPVRAPRIAPSGAPSLIDIADLAAALGLVNLASAATEVLTITLTDDRWRPMTGLEQADRNR